jgi:hypothetical protein
VAEAPDPIPQPDPRPETPDPRSEASTADEHPEILVGAAFVGGFALAQIMKRFGR